MIADPVWRIKVIDTTSAKPKLIDNIYSPLDTSLIITYNTPEHPQKNFRTFLHTLFKGEHLKPHE